MRIMIKGGVWKNTEDEILKAAVMKYGLNQWARISSLLVRKSAKQCKARWYEWLDPSIKKTEWTREEDEKLLHLAKLLPTQWRTIAPIVGRTPAQCLERYEKLLDMAVSKDERYDPADDPRRLRPGEIDPNPESKPARPDPVDMDEDEKEMLSEARARLANTRGKKAKRKAREKALEEARRLASLQKKRELKAAGIESRGGWKRRRGIDYSHEVAFEKKPAPGFFDTGEEVARAKQMGREFRPVTVEELEGRRRKDIEEALVKQDSKRQRMLEESGAPGAAAAAAAAARAAEQAAEQSAGRRRGKLMLPAPQVSEAEMQEVARLAAGGGGLDAELLAAGAGGDATVALLGSYGATPARFATPMRTPRVTADGQDPILLQAQHLARLAALPTPLAGGEHPDIAELDFSGATPRRTPGTVGATPRLAGTPSRAGTALVPSRGLGATLTPAVAGTPLRPGATPLMTPGGAAALGRTPALRDELGLNESDSAALALAAAGQAGGAAARLAQRALREELRRGLGALPEPSKDYVLEVGGLDDDDAGAAAVGMEEDAADAKARRAREEAERRRIAELKKSQVLQRKLPRPVSLENLPDTAAPVHLDRLSLRERAESALHGELAVLLMHDNARYPPPRPEGDKDKDKPTAPGPAHRPLPDYDLEELQAASALLRGEVAVIRRAMGHDGAAEKEYFDVWSAAHKDFMYLPSQRHYARAASATNQERLDAAKAEYGAVLEEMRRAAKRAARLEAKAKLLMGGLVARHEKGAAAVERAAADAASVGVELACFTALQAQEALAAPRRRDALTEGVARLRGREDELQLRYKELSQRCADLAEQRRAVRSRMQQLAVELAAATAAAAAGPAVANRLPSLTDLAKQTSSVPSVSLSAVAAG